MTTKTIAAAARTYHKATFAIKQAVGANSYTYSANDGLRNLLLSVSIVVHIDNAGRQVAYPKRIQLHLPSIRSRVCSNKEDTS